MVFNLTTVPIRIIGRAAKNDLAVLKIKAPADFDRVLSDWSHLLRHWNDKIEELLLYRRFFAGRNTTPIRAEAARLTKRLAKLDR